MRANSSRRLARTYTIVIPDDLAFGLSRMFEVYREGELADHVVFRTEEEARTWLRK